MTGRGTGYLWSKILCGARVLEEIYIAVVHDLAQIRTVWCDLEDDDVIGASHMCMPGRREKHGCSSIRGQPLVRFFPCALRVFGPSSLLGLSDSGALCKWTPIG